MKMNDMRAMLADAAGDIDGCAAIPNRGGGDFQAAVKLDVVVVDDVGLDLVAVASQQFGFGGEYLVFPAGLLVEVVADQDAHAPSISLIARCRLDIAGAEAALRGAASDSGQFR
jgi:hypothetical protein